MENADAFPWGRLILGGALALALSSVLVALVGPLAAIRVAGGNDYQIRDDAMAPALLPGDWVLVEAMLPGRAPPRGTIVVYRRPRERDVHKIMRVVGLPGERIQMRGGALYVDGRRATMERLDDRVIPKRRPGRRAALPLCINEPVRIDGDCHQEVWRETLPGGVTGIILNTRRKIGLAALTGGESGDDTTMFTVPGGKVFVIGDNRDSAIDSRFESHGLVPVHDLLYSVWMIHTSLDRSASFLSPRWDRLFREVR